MKNQVSRGRWVLTAVYVLSIAAAYTAGIAWAGYGALTASAIAVAVAVLVIFAGSMVFNNSSVFDPYWSVAPPLMVLLYLALLLETSAGLEFQQAITGNPRLVILFVLTVLYGSRLTWNFLRGWPGLSHEDWRYDNFRKTTGRLYWLVSFAGIHFFPALMVFGGTLSVWAVVNFPSKPLGFNDLLGVLIILKGIALEAVADNQLRAFTGNSLNKGKTITSGLWSISRHPNYYGEIMVWWGFCLMGLSANPDAWWVILGPLAITLMFVFISIPLIEKRLLERKEDYPAYRARVPFLIPWMKFRR
jgi:steroid 5-alpha reductase family enzyme